MEQQQQKDYKELSYSELLVEKNKYDTQYMELISPTPTGNSKKDQKTGTRALNLLMDSLFRPEKYPELTHHLNVLHELWILDMCNPSFFPERRA